MTAVLHLTMGYFSYPYGYKIVHWLEVCALNEVVIILTKSDMRYENYRNCNTFTAGLKIHRMRSQWFHNYFHRVVRILNLNNKILMVLFSMSNQNIFICLRRLNLVFWSRSLGKMYSSVLFVPSTSCIRDKQN